MELLWSYRPCDAIGVARNDKKIVVAGLFVQPPNRYHA
jgi:hypothetical protein